MDPTSAKVVPALATLYVAWRVYVRFRRNVGRQALRPGRMIWGIVFFGIISLLIALASFAYQPALLSYGGGLLLGLPFAFAGLHLTKFETTPEGHFYTPNTHIGLALTLLLAGRVVYRIVLLFGSSAANATSAAFMQSPLTLGIVGLTAGYYIAYNSGVLWHTRDKVA
jgi:hypothetical protein